MKKNSTPKQIEIHSKELIRSSIKVYLSALGPIGTAIDELLFGIGDRIRAKRVEIFVAQLTEEVKNLKEENIDQNFLNSEEFHDILLQSLSNSIKTRHVEKIKLFAKILIGSFLPESDSEISEDYMFIVSNLTLKDIRVLRSSLDLAEKLKIEKQKSDNPVEFDDFINKEKLAPNLDFSNSEIDFSLTKLSTFGLLKEYYSGNTFGPTPGGNYKETEKLNQFVKLITVTNNGEHAGPL